MRALAFALSLLTAAPALAAPDMARIVEGHVLPGYQALARETAHLADTAAQGCAPDSPELQTAYHAAFDAWVSVSHLRFGPSEQDDRAFALAFWPDPRSATPKALAGLIATEDPVVETPEAFTTVSIAARGFYALEYLLFDPHLVSAASPAYHCALVQAITSDIAANAEAILASWEGGYGALMIVPGNDTYRSETEAAQQMFTALTTGLEFTANARLGRPLGSFDAPRPTRAEARRSGRSLRHVVLSLTATRDLAALISGEDAGVDAAFADALARAEGLQDPTLAGVSDPASRFRIEALQQEVDALRRLLAEQVGPSLGLAAGFNALDGD
ncbi:imelysin family protein [Pseudoruegeria sp. SHC-113]|uniref:imelysin family protein n=1 Tax=Pseudoruegeria sp. SHC-113 TaxID=2855439 RepID=UPI0021BB674B|nr:imelysin family protein [Pseudoruegeria sp. SHC-113]MCT8162175.1 imelysin family protein [Pseudoruegeria sp. SHC-113]